MDFYIEVVRGDKYITTKVKSCKDETSANFHNEILAPKKLYVQHI